MSSLEGRSVTLEIGGLLELELDGVPYEGTARIGVRRDDVTERVDVRGCLFNVARLGTDNNGDDRGGVKLN